MGINLENQIKSIWLAHSCKPIYLDFREWRVELLEVSDMNVPAHVRENTKSQTNDYVTMSKPTTNLKSFKANHEPEVQRTNPKQKNKQQLQKFW